jgi:hypothetical protein
MEFREETAIALNHYNDEIFKVSYLRILTSTKIESVKLPTVIDNYKFSHLLNPNYLLGLELIKTKKNWVLRNISSSDRISQPTSYLDFLRQSEIIKLVLEHIREDQEIEILGWLVYILGTKLDTLDMAKFESELLRRLGFGGK